MKRHASLGRFLLTLLISSAAWAQGTPLTLAEQHYGAVAYVSGGIGDDERDEIRAREKDFNLRLLFCERDGTYLANIDVRLTNAKGETVLEAKSVGPFLLAQLPSGNYAVEVSSNGQRQQGKLSIPPKGRREGVFRW